MHRDSRLRMNASLRGKLNWCTEMKLARPSACCGSNHGARPAVTPLLRIGFLLSAFVGLSGCEQNTFVPPPPPKVEVAIPVQRSITRFLETTGTTAPVKSVDLVARVQGFLQSIDYQDGTFVKQGT